jgi:hypothetical protein
MRLFNNNDVGPMYSQSNFFLLHKLHRHILPSLPTTHPPIPWSKASHFTGQNLRNLQGGNLGRPHCVHGGGLMRTQCIRTYVRMRYVTHTHQKHPTSCSRSRCSRSRCLRSRLRRRRARTRRLVTASFASDSCDSSSSYPGGRCTGTP